MKPIIISFFWGSLSRLEWVCFNSFVKLGFEVELYTCNNMRVPDGVKLKSASQYINCSDIKLYGPGAGSGEGSPSLTSNIFRYRILSERKSVCWVDSDMLCLSDFSIDDEYLFGYERDSIINSAILGVGQLGDVRGLFSNLAQYVEYPFKFYYSDHPKVFLKKLWAKLKRRTSWGDVPWGVTGPLAVTSMVKRLGLLHFAKPSNYFYPIPFRDASLFFQPMSNNQFDRYFSRAFTSHLWNEVLRHKGKNKNTIFHKDSPFERMIAMSALDSEWNEG